MKCEKCGKEDKITYFGEKSEEQINDLIEQLCKCKPTALEQWKSFLTGQGVDYQINEWRDKNGNLKSYSLTILGSIDFNPDSSLYTDIKGGENDEK